jgi:hypothetical protein
MSLIIDRRALLITAGFGVGGLILPGGQLAAQTLAFASGFTHNVASGEPGPTSMLLWTRFRPREGGPARVSVEVSETADFARVISGGQMVTGPWRDYTVKITVDGLKPGPLVAPRLCRLATSKISTSRCFPVQTWALANSTLMATPQRAATLISSFIWATISMNMSAAAMMAALNLPNASSLKMKS